MGSRTRIPAAPTAVSRISKVPTVPSAIVRTGIPVAGLPDSVVWSFCAESAPKVLSRFGAGSVVVAMASSRLHTVSERAVRATRGTDHWAIGVVLVFPFGGNPAIALREAQRLRAVRPATTWCTGGAGRAGYAR